MQKRTGVVTGGLVALLMTASAPASAATPPVGSYATFAATAPGSFDVSFSANSAFPAAQVVTTDTAGVAASGKSAFLGESTGFGAQFGSSRLQPYLTLGVSSTVVTFDATTAPGFGFALGDIDADYVTIAATGPGGPLTAAELGVGGGALNYCNNVPKPSGCGAGTSFADAPTWCPDPTAAPVCAGYALPTLVGSGSNTLGAYGWFVPRVPVTAITLDYGALIGFPSYQLWLAAPAPAATVAGRLVVDGGTVPPGTELALLTGTGEAVRDIEDEPVTVPVAPDGAYSFVTELGSYQLDVILPPGSTLVDPPNLVFSVTVDVDLGVLAIVDPNQLAATGVDPLPLVLLAGGLGVVGLVLRRARAG